jgi:3-hydroxyisobutyrate dehydrogenase-like beta-hydroxyacid dehydrogenase
MFHHAAIIGFGEVGRIFARDLRAKGVERITAYDIGAVPPADGVIFAASAPEAVRDAELAISSVTAGSAMEALQAALPGLRHGPYVLDVNSVSPGTKRKEAAIVEAAGGRFVEAAVMTSVPPKGLASPMWLGGPHAAAFVEDAEGLEMDLRVFSDTVGGASSVKMSRSIMIKGLEALVTECMQTARHYGVEQLVLDSLGDTLPHADWRALARYTMSRALIHGKRRAEELREVAVTVREAGIPAIMAPAIAERQALAAEQGKLLPKEILNGADLDALLDALLAQRDRKPQASD